LVFVMIALHVGFIHNQTYAVGDDRVVLFRLI
jgi:hypothetical protein